MAIILLLLSFAYIVYFIVIPIIGRRLIYPSESKITKYPGSGQIVKPFEATILVNPKDEGLPFFDIPANKARYTDQPNFEVFEIPSQDRISYTVGKFQSWEDIPNNVDKYLVIKNPITNNLERHRVAFENSDLFKSNPTSYFIERVDLFSKTNVNFVLKQENSYFKTFGYNEAKIMFKKGDALILIPVFDPPELQKRDEQNNLLISKIIIRRTQNRI